MIVNLSIGTLTTSTSSEPGVGYDIRLSGPAMMSRSDGRITPLETSMFERRCGRTRSIWLTRLSRKERQLGRQPSRNIHMFGLLNVPDQILLSLRLQSKPTTKPTILSILELEPCLIASPLRNCGLANPEPMSADKAQPITHCLSFSVSRHHAKQHVDTPI